MRRCNARCGPVPMPIEIQSRVQHFQDILHTGTAVRGAGRYRYHAFRCGDPVQTRSGIILSTRFVCIGVMLCIHA